MLPRQDTTPLAQFITPPQNPQSHIPQTLSLLHHLEMSQDPPDGLQRHAALHLGDSFVLQDRSPGHHDVFGGAGAFPLEV